MTYAAAAIGWTVAMLALLWLTVHAIDRLDRWGRKTHPSLRIVVPEQTVADVVPLQRPVVSAVREVGPYRRQR